MDNLNTHFFEQRKYIFFAAFILLSFITGTFFIYLFTAASKNTTHVSTGSFKAVSRPFHDIKGFEYSHNENGHRVFSISADRFTVNKKKMGLIRVALAKEIVLRNARVDIYRQPREKINLDCIADKKVIDRFKAKRSAAIILRPATLRVHDPESGKETTLSALQAGYDIKSRQLTFEKKVRVICGDRTLTAQRAAVTSKEGGLSISGGYIYKTGEKTLEGDSITTNIYLDNIQ